MKKRLKKGQVRYLSLCIECHRILGVCRGTRLETDKGWLETYIEMHHRYTYHSGHHVDKADPNKSNIKRIFSQ